MLKKTLSYPNLDGETITKDWYFQITKSEVAEKAMVEGEDYGERLAKLAQQTDGRKIIEEFKKILREAVGQRDGQLFVKTKEIQDEFMFSGAYDVFFMEMLESPDSGASIIRAMLPKDVDLDSDLAKQARESMGITTVELPASAPQLASVPEPGADGVVHDAATQAAKPQPDLFPTNLEAAIAANKPANAQAVHTSDDPAWLKENRNPTRAELMKMGKDEMQLAAKMREAGLLS